MTTTLICILKMQLENFLKFYFDLIQNKIGEPDFSLIV